jgi:hypothetical protein
MPPKGGQASGGNAKGVATPENLSSGSNSSTATAARRSSTNVDRLKQLPLANLSAGDVAACLASTLPAFKTFVAAWTASAFSGSFLATRTPSLFKAELLKLFPDDTTAIGIRGVCFGWVKNRIISDLSHEHSSVDKDAGSLWTSAQYEPAAAPPAEPRISIPPPPPLGVNSDPANSADADALKAAQVSSAAAALKAAQAAQGFLSAAASSSSQLPAAGNSQAPPSPRSSAAKDDSAQFRGGGIPPPPPFRSLANVQGYGGGGQSFPPHFHFQAKPNSFSFGPKKPGLFSVLNGAQPFISQNVFAPMPFGQSQAQMPHGQSQLAQMPLGQLPEQMPLGQSHIAQMPFGPQSAQMPNGQLPEQMPLGQSQNAQMPLGQLQEQMPLGQSHLFNAAAAQPLQQFQLDHRGKPLMPWEIEAIQRGPVVADPNMMPGFVRRSVYKEIEVAKQARIRNVAAGTPQSYDKVPYPTMINFTAEDFHATRKAYYVAIRKSIPSCLFQEFKFCFTDTARSAAQRKFGLQQEHWIALDDEKLQGWLSIMFGPKSKADALRLLKKVKFPSHRDDDHSQADFLV